MIYFWLDDAISYGVTEAILLSHISFWIAKNKANDRHFYDDRTWTYNSIKAYKNFFPFWSVDQIRRGLKSLVDQGVIITGNYNKVGYDRTIWYALFDESVLNRHIQSPVAKTTNAFGENHKCIWRKPQMQLAKTTNAIGENHKPIPDNNTDTNQKNTQIGEFAGKVEMTPEIETMLKARAARATGRD